MCCVCVLQVLVQPADQGMYRVHTPHFVVPCLVPLLRYTFQVRVEDIVTVSFFTALTMSCDLTVQGAGSPPGGLLHRASVLQ
jgi:hypothetical protein